MRYISWKAGGLTLLSWNILVCTFCPFYSLYFAETEQSFSPNFSRERFLGPQREKKKRAIVKWTIENFNEYFNPIDGSIMELSTQLNLFI